MGLYNKLMAFNIEIKEIPGSEKVILRTEHLRGDTVIIFEHTYESPDELINTTGRNRMFRGLESITGAIIGSAGIGTLLAIANHNPNSETIVTALSAIGATSLGTYLYLNRMLYALHQKDILTKSYSKFERKFVPKTSEIST